MRQTESIEKATQRRDTMVAAGLSIAGLVALVVARGGIESMIAGSVGSVGAGCLAVGLTFLDGRMTYAHRVQACLPIVFMLGLAGIVIKSHALALAGYPLLLLGIVGLVPAILRFGNARPAADTKADKRPIPRATNTPALSNS